MEPTITDIILEALAIFAIWGAGVCLLFLLPAIFPALG